MTFRTHFLLGTVDPRLSRPRLSGSRTEIIARAYNDLRMRVVAVDKKLLYTWLLNQLFCQLKIGRLLDKAVYHSAPLVARPVHSSWLFSPCSHQLVSVYGPLFTFPDFSLIRHGFPTTLAKGVRIIEGSLYYGSSILSSPYYELLVIFVQM